MYSPDAYQIPTEHDGQDYGHRHGSMKERHGRVIGTKLIGQPSVDSG
jgi:hypothetical protein